MDPENLPEKSKKRDRSINFSQEETDRLIALIKPRRHIIESKKNDSATWHKKELAWKSIEVDFNKSFTGVVRNAKNLKLKYEAMKRDTKKKTYRMVHLNGGREVTPPRLTPAEEQIRDMIFENAKEDDSLYESDRSCSSGDQRECSGMYTEVKIEKMPHIEQHREEKPFAKQNVETNDLTQAQKQLISEEMNKILLEKQIIQQELEYKRQLHKLEVEHLELKIEIEKKRLTILKEKRALL